MNDTAIQFHNISKQYRLGLVTTGTLSHDLNRWWQTAIRKKEDPYLRIGEVNDRTKKGSSDYVWALRNIDFEVKQGEVLGIIGKNGSGKSTLLKILSRITTPTTGMIEAWGRVASLLEVGTGFHPELTGRENIYMNGSILGMTKKEIDRKIDEIIDFSGVERYLDTPVKRYSSGMIVRLGFSIAAHLEPDILVIDEVLAVGDAEFQKKAIGKVEDVSQNDGRTVLFVSHNLEAVNTLCDTSILLDNGELVKQGKTGDIIEYYTGNRKYHSTLEVDDRKLLRPHFKDIQIKTSASQGIHYFGDSLSISLQVFFPYRVNACALSFQIKDAANEVPVVYNWYSTAGELKRLVNRNGLCTVAINIPSLRLYKGNYYFRFSLSDPRGKIIFDKVDEFFLFEVNMSKTSNEWGWPNGPKYIETTVCEVK
ncbi:MAG: ATP-binding cassette domain-containing protein [Bacteroidales bacterium]|jgi:lipopolysaccharide transport system ATP-binding protein|nr:ATP-binding cassette domain-containing protein [Bacteroidales bacterium]